MNKAAAKDKYYDKDWKEWNEMMYPDEGEIE